MIWQAKTITFENALQKNIAKIFTSSRRKGHAQLQVTVDATALQLYYNYNTFLTFKLLLGFITFTLL